MKRPIWQFSIIQYTVWLLMLLLPQTAGAQAPNGGKAQGSEPILSLEDLEKMALEHSPTLAQAAANIRAAEGRKTQASLFPNPTVGYTGEEISGGSIVRGGEHGFFVEQTIVTAGKRGLSGKVFAKEQAASEAEAKAERYRVLSKVRLLYYQALGAERRVEVWSELAGIARRAVDTSKQLRNVGQADEPDVLEAEIEVRQAELSLASAKNHRERVWRQLGAVVGDPSLTPSRVAGKLDDPLPELNRESTLEAILRDSPELKVAEAEVERAEMAAKRARVEKIPDIRVRAGLRENRERLESIGRPVGLEGFADVGVEIPVFNRNQGNVKSTQAELARAQQDVLRIRLSLRTRYAAAFKEYSDAAEAAKDYQKEMLPRARRAYDLYLSKYRQMAAAYPQVLIAQRTLFQLQEDYVAALENLWRAASEIRGFLLVDGPGSPSKL